MSVTVVDTARELLEPAAANLGGMRIQEAAAVSQAISLKRIADALTDPNRDLQMTETIKNGIWLGAQEAIAHWHRNR